jgi:hypothetical protein
MEAIVTSCSLITVSKLPGIDNHEVNHPRWTNHPRFMAFTGPYRTGAQASHASASGSDVEIYLGRFSEAFSGIE